MEWKGMTRRFLFVICMISNLYNHQSLLDIISYVVSSHSLNIYAVSVLALLNWLLIGPLKGFILYNALHMLIKTQNFIPGLCPKSISGSILWRNDGSIWTSAIGILLKPLSISTIVPYGAVLIWCMYAFATKYPLWWFYLLLVMSLGSWIVSDMLLKFMSEITENPKFISEIIENNSWGFLGSYKV